MARSLSTLALCFALSGCAGVVFHDHDGKPSRLEYYQTIPAMLVTVDAECKVASQVVSLPGESRSMDFRSGLGRSETNVTFGPGGTISSINAKNEGAVDDALKIAQAVMGVAANNVVETNLPKGEQPAKPACKPTALAYRIRGSGGEVTVDKTPVFVSVLSDAVVRAQAPDKKN